MITINTNIHTAYYNCPTTNNKTAHLPPTHNNSSNSPPAPRSSPGALDSVMPDTLSSRSRCFRILAENTGPLIFLFVLFVVVVSGGRGSSNQMPQQNKNKKGGKKVPAKKQGSAPKKRSPIAEALEDSLSMYKHATVV